MAFTPPLQRSDIVAALLRQSQQRPRRAPTSAIEGLVNAGNSLSNAYLARKLIKRETAEALNDNLATIDAFNTLAGTPAELAAKGSLIDTVTNQGIQGLVQNATSDFSLGTPQPPNSAIAKALGGNAPTAELSGLDASVVNQLNPQGNAIFQDQFNQGDRLQAQASLRSAETANPNARARSVVEAAKKRSPAVAAKFANVLLPDLLETPESFTTISGAEAEAQGFAPGTVVSRSNSTNKTEVVQGPQKGSSPSDVVIIKDAKGNIIGRTTDVNKAIQLASDTPGATLDKIGGEAGSNPPSGFRPTADGFSLEPVPGGPGDIQNQNLRNSMSRGVAAVAADLYGGIYDPETGRISGIDKGQRERVLDTQVQAMELLQSGQANNIQEAVQMAFKGTGGGKGDATLAQALSDARAAIAGGADASAVRKQFEELGFDPTLLDQ